MIDQIYDADPALSHVRYTVCCSSLRRCGKGARESGKVAKGSTERAKDRVGRVWLRKSCVLRSFDLWGRPGLCI